MQIRMKINSKTKPTPPLFCVSSEMFVMRYRVKIEKAISSQT